MKALQFIDSFNKNSKIFLVGLNVCFLASCGNNPPISTQAKDVEHISIKRFEQDLIPIDTIHVNESHFSNIAKKYNEFYFGFCENTLGILPETKDPYYAYALTGFVKYPSIQMLKHEIDSLYSNLNDLEDGLSVAMNRYRTEFPKAKVPKFVSYLSEFTEAHCAYDSIIGIGLDMYLGKDYPYYPAEFPDFMRKKMTRDYILPNTLKAMAISNFDIQLKDKRFLAYMLFEGKVRYFVKKLMPELADTLVFGYTKTQMDWCNESEGQIWSFVIDKKLLYNKNPNDYMRLLTDAPFTSAEGIPQESAPMLGAYCGYKIIENYADKTGASLEEVMNNNNWDEILKESAYRPK
jgi:hypothetical protein